MSDVGWPSLVALVGWVLPAVLLMGCAFPLLVRLGTRGIESAGSSFGAVSAANTVGGILGALLAPFVLLPVLGLLGGVVACGAMNAALGLLLALPGARHRGEFVLPTCGVLAFGLLSWAALRPKPPPAPFHVLFADHGRQASAAVVRVGGRRDLYVDAEAEASTAGHARHTEELLAVLPLLLHPDPRRVLEVGLGSGITLATAARFDLEQIRCVEISDSVLQASAFFAPDNGVVSRGGDRRLKIVRGDGRADLARRAGAYDVIVANTVQPWSLGATGLYSREYFARLARALDARGIAVQWLPVEAIGARHLEAILRTFFSVFPEGALWWAAESVIVVGARGPVPDELPPPEDVRWIAAQPVLRRMGLGAAGDLALQRLAGASEVREALGPGEVLTDDVPTLESLFGPRAVAREGGELALLARIARVAERRGSGSGALLLWLDSRTARQDGQMRRADGLERLAQEAGLSLARQGRVARIIAEGYAALGRRQFELASSRLRQAISELPTSRDARFGLAMLAVERGALEGAEDELTLLLTDHPEDAEALNLLGVVQRRQNRPQEAKRTFLRALENDPFLPQALANAGIVAAELGDLDAARRHLVRLRAISPLGVTQEESALERRLADARIPPG